MVILVIILMMATMGMTCSVTVKMKMKGTTLMVQSEMTKMMMQASVMKRTGWWRTQRTAGLMKDDAVVMVCAGG